MENLDILVIGGSGFIGAKLVQAVGKSYQKVAYTYTSQSNVLPAKSYRVQIQADYALENCILETHPRCIVYCAVPRSGSDESLHEVVSLQGIQRVCNVLKEIRSCKLIYVSTNSVFSGQHGPYREDATPDPENRHDHYRIYGITRAQGEQAALNAWPDTIVARTADVNGEDAAGNLNPRLLRLISPLQAGRPIERLKNATISPTFVDNLVDCLLEISAPDFKYRGVLHLAGRQQISYYDFAVRVAKKIKANEQLITEDFSKAWHIGLDTRFTQRLLKTPFQNVDEQLKAIFR